MTRDAGPDPYGDRTRYLERMETALTQRGYTIEIRPGRAVPMDFLAQLDERTLVGATLVPPYRAQEIILLAEQAAEADGLVLIGPSKDVLMGAMNTLRQPYRELTPTGIVPYTRDTIVEFDDGARPVVPVDANWHWTVTADGILSLTVDDTVVAAGDAGDAVTSYTYELPRLTTTDDAAVVCTPAGTVLDLSSDLDALTEAYSPIELPLVPRASEYRSVLGEVRPWFIEGKDPVELDTTARWVPASHTNHRKLQFIHRAIKEFTDTHLVTTADGEIPYEEFLEVFTRWFTAETGRRAPSRHIIGINLSTERRRRVTDEGSKLFLPGHTWRIPRGIASPDIPIDPEVVDG